MASERALELATQSRALAGDLGWGQGLSEALGLIGMARLNMGDRTGLEEVERSVDVAAAAGAFEALARAYNLQAVAQQMVGDLDAGFASQRRMFAFRQPYSELLRPSSDPMALRGLARRLRGGAVARRERAPARGQQRSGLTVTAALSALGGRRCAVRSRIVDGRR